MAFGTPGGSFENAVMHERNMLVKYEHGKLQPKICKIVSLQRNRIVNIFIGTDKKTVTFEWVGIICFELVEWIK